MLLEHVLCFPPLIPMLYLELLHIALLYTRSIVLSRFTRCSKEVQHFVIEVKCRVCRAVPVPGCGGLGRGSGAISLH